ncbi:MAG: discoidin domain-containing protein [Chitinophagaceae bacterium]|nr:discoidin domain-containing protein [Chitinophagaceae bacterium]
MKHAFFFHGNNKKSFRQFFAVVIILLIIIDNVLAQTSGIITYCNPMDINYQYNFEQLNSKISYRSGADPVIVNHNGGYYLFVTISGGYWHSNDLLHWNYITPTKWPMEDICAPAALSVRDTLYLFQSTFEQRPIFFTTTPENGRLYFYNRWLPQLPKEVGPWDPAIFYDEAKDKWYMYWGSSNVYPIYGAELDKNKQLTYKSDYKGLISLHPDQHGWERFGRNHRDTIKPYIEGAWMTKYHDKYFLQYGAPGTEFNVYANGTYVSDNPLGPFEYAPYNPVSYKPGGFMTGAGHGNTFQDTYGNYWNTGTPWIAINWNFERRISMFPAGFDEDDQMYSNTRFGDFPQYLPTGKWNDRNDLFTGWMLLSYQKPCRASSVMDTFVANKTTDEDPRTFWVADNNSAGEWITIDLLQPCEVRAVQVNFVDYKSDIFYSDSTVYTQFRLYASMDGKQWNKIADLTNEKRDRPNAYIELTKPEQARYIKYDHVYVAAPNLAISDIRVFGKGKGNLPAIPAKPEVVRDSDARNAMIKWNGVKGAVGYNILWGIAKDKLYQTYQVFQDDGNSLELRALNVGQSYYFAIEVFNEVGVSGQSPVVFIK